ncbi:MAG: hypothetical protein M1823_001953 [Watsoniomyces obsoletus]|nr:MAG: hypothetical protein M1823_001953 [Watsoniomyces obsoletus]
MSFVMATTRLVLVWSVALALVGHLVQAMPSPETLSKRDRVMLMQRQLGTLGITGVQSGRGSDGSVPFRLEIRQMQIQNPDQWNLYLLGLERLQAVDQNQLLSWYQISGIHGRPYTDWDGVPAAPGQNNNGYCTHTSVLFGTWHRPYLALYEQVLYNTIQQIVNEFNGTEQERYRGAAETFRIPYWDWAAAPADNGPVLPTSVSSAADVTVNSPTGIRSMRNPLYAYRFSQLNTNDLPDPPLSRWITTLRYPTGQGAGATSRNNLVEQQLRNNRLSYRDRLYNLFTAYSNYTEFASKAWFPDNGGNYDSIESVHDQIHGLTGNGGHMSYVDYSAFDPIFYLHHTMVDRIAAMWQVLHPETFVEPRANSFGTYTTAPGGVEDANSPLTPFHSNDQGAFWTSNSARSEKTFGYTYPELVDWNVSPEQLRTNVRAAVNRLYGNTAPANVVVRRRSDGQPVRSISPRGLDGSERLTPRGDIGGGKQQSNEGEINGGDRLVRRTNYTDPTLADTPKGVSRDGKYNEYIANIRVQKHALDGSFFVHIFLGDYSPDAFAWAFEPNLVGSHCVFQKDPGACSKCDVANNEVEVTGVIPLTTALLESIKQGKICSLDPEEVDPYLKENLHWRVSKMDDTSVPNEEVPGLQVTVISAEVRKPNNDEEFPEWGAPQTRADVTEDKKTGYHEGDSI